MPVQRELRRTDEDRRKSQRILVDLEVDYQCEDTFLFAYITDLSAFGIFIRTNNPEPPGTRLNLRFRLPAENVTMALEGEVIWINAFRPGDFNNLNPGMGVKFVDLTDEDKAQVLDLIRKVAYLDDHEGQGTETVSGEGDDDEEDASEDEEDEQAAAAPVGLDKN
jgi:type IV pilus assembly protein PilZ